ncbi:MAG: NTP transferase domain-containing protein [Nitrospirae bacterium]|nr:NTP transferase domain-containing protein [Nitrospirota bacterium]
MNDIVILCGGIGSRLQAVVSDRPKPMAQMGDRSFLDILIIHAASYGYKRFILCTGYKQGFIRDYYQDKFRDLEIIISEESSPLGTAGAVKNAQSFIKSDVFFAMNGDSFCQLDYNDFMSFHKNKNAFISIALVLKENISEYGRVLIDESSRIISFSEKINLEDIGLINGGVYIFNQRVFDHIPQMIQYSIEYDLFPKILDKVIYGYEKTGKFIDIGTPERYTQAKDYLRSFL